jgi:hypothetical protein
MTLRAAPRPGNERIRRMSRQSGPYTANRRPLWLRHDAHLWIRHDIKRFFKPGTDPADVIPALRWRRDRERDREDAAFAAEIAKGYRLIAALREEVASIRADLLRRRLAEQTKYSPAQPRVPAGNPRGGQWTDRSGVGSQGTGFALPMGNVDVGDVSGSSELTPGDTSVGGVQLAGDPVDLLEQEQRGGHAISEHADRTYDYLKSRAREEGERTLDRGDAFRGFSVGSFTSVQSANRLVNSTISENQDKVDQGIRDGEPAVVISKRFPSPTGYEAYLARAHAEPVIRDTFGVKVFILPDQGSARGWRVHSAYPVR